MPQQSPFSGELSIQEKILLARGGSPDSAGARLEVLVALSGDTNEEVRQAAKETLARLPDPECARLIAAPNLADAVTRYFLKPAHFRPALLPLLLGHPDTPPEAIVELAASAGPEAVPFLLDQMDLLKTPALIALKDNPTYLHWQKEPPQHGYILEAGLLDLLIQEMETEKPATVEQLQAALSVVEVPAEQEKTKTGLVSKIAHMEVAQRVKLALLGSREERSLLIRDSSRVVCRAVLSSPKLTESETEGFATLKNVSQEVLRMISMSRKFMKNYTVLKNLVNNPRTPIDVSLPLVNRLLPNDLRVISGSRDVPETIRKMAQKLIRDRTS